MNQGADPFDLRRFELAQAAGDTYQTALRELRAGSKLSHWMWFVFPQFAGLGRTQTAQIYAISSLAEAQAYGRHPVLGARLVECAGVLVALTGRSAEAILGPVDAMKLRSSMTLFGIAAPHERVFQRVLAQYFGGIPDDRTEALL